MKSSRFLLTLTFCEKKFIPFDPYILWEVIYFFRPLHFVRSSSFLSTVTHCLFTSKTVRSCAKQRWRFGLYQRLPSDCVSVSIRLISFWLTQFLFHLEMVVRRTQQMAVYGPLRDFSAMITIIRSGSSRDDDLVKTRKSCELRASQASRFLWISPSQHRVIPPISLCHWFKEMLFECCATMEYFWTLTKTWGVLPRCQQARLQRIVELASSPLRYIQDTPWSVPNLGDSGKSSADTETHEAPTLEPYLEC